MAGSSAFAFSVKESLCVAVVMGLAPMIRTAGAGKPSLNTSTDAAEV